MKKLLSFLLITGLILLSPGTDFYLALGQTKKTAAPVVPSAASVQNIYLSDIVISLPLSIPTYPSFDFPLADKIYFPAPISLPVTKKISPSKTLSKPIQPLGTSKIDSAFESPYQPAVRRAVSMAKALGTLSQEEVAVAVPPSSSLLLVRKLKRFAGNTRSVVRQVGKLVRGDEEIKPLMKPYHRQFHLAVGLQALSALLGISKAFLVGALLDAAVSAGQTGLTAHVGSLLLFSSLLTGFYFTGLFVQRKNIILSGGGDLGVIEAGLVRDIWVGLYRHTLNLEMDFHMKQDSTALAARFKDDVEFLGAKNIGIRTPLLAYALSLGLGTFLMFKTSFILSALAFSVVPLLGIINGVFGQKLSVVYLKFSNLRADLARFTQQVLSLVDIVKVFGRVDQEGDRFAEKADDLVRVGAQDAKLRATSHALSSSLTDLFTKYLVYIIGGFIAVSSGMSMGSVISFALYAKLIKPAFDGFSMSWQQFKQYEGGTQVIREIYRRTPAIQDASDAVDLPSIKGRVRFEEVSFSYAKDGSTEPILRDVSFETRPGQVIALVGEKGSGKSSILKLLLRLWDMDGGRITIDGHDIRKVKLKSLSSQMALVPQDTKLFHGSIRYNMLYGSEGVTGEELEAAIRMAKADFVFDEGRFPQGLETHVGEMGNLLSGGERQRVAIVRAILRRPKILVLDEATSALDNESERLVQQALDNLMHEHANRPTMFVVAHRLTTIQNADLILVLDKGQIVERGTHRALMRKKGRYYQQWMASLEEKK
ncbi:MAG: ABC transporter ATP-binding protein [Elusimicrobia bacterium]|nr:ABC transporter ATP-binding protein [Elusimicrobiota bacterium]